MESWVRQFRDTNLPRGPPSAKKQSPFEAANGVTAAANGVTAATSKKCGFTGISDEATLLKKP